MKSKPKNIRGLFFKEQEAGFSLVGSLAGLVTKQKALGRRRAIRIRSAGRRSPRSTGTSRATGRRRGSHPWDHDAERLLAGSSTGEVPELALDQIARGAHVILAVAGGSVRLGALSAAKEKNVRGIGVDKVIADWSEPGDSLQGFTER